MNSKQTKYVALDAHRCAACWQCVEKCPKQVIGKVSVMWHRHAVFRHPEACVGCRQCVKVCPHGAFSAVSTVAARSHKRSDGRLKRVFLLTTAGIVVTGLGLHAAGHHPDFPVWHRWAVAHVAVSVLWLALAGHHLWRHRLWYKTLLLKGIGRKSKMMLLLTTVSLALWDTGTVLLGCIDGPNSAMGLWHYGLGLCFCVLSVLHIVRRRRGL